MEIREDTILKLEKRTVYSLENFWEGTPCLEWTGSIKNNGYGQIANEKVPMYTHRLSWIINNGEIPDGLYVLHHCDNRKCCNIKHLFIGTQKENVEDMISKNRKPILMGEKSPSPKLKERDVLEILKLYRSGKYTQMQLAEMYGIDRTVISNIHTGKTWRHIFYP